MGSNPNTRTGPSFVVEDATSPDSTSFVVDAGGNVGIGNATPTVALDVNGAILNNNTVTTSGANGGFFAADRSTSGTGGLYRTGGVNRLWDSSAGDVLVWTTAGNVGIGTTTPTAQLSTTGTVRFSNFGAGTLQTDANGNVSVSSDERLKHVEGAFTKGLDAILDLEPISFTWKASTGFDTANVYTGFSAQNVKLAIPEAVGEDKHGFLTLSERPILAAVVNAVKELHEGAAALQATVAEFAVEFFSNRLRTNELCVGSTCITESELKEVLEARGTAGSDQSGDSVGDDNPEPDDEIEPPPSESDTDALQGGEEPPSDPGTESSRNSEEVTAAEGSFPPVEDPADEPDNPPEPSEEAPSPTSAESSNSEPAD